MSKQMRIHGIVSWLTGVAAVVAGLCLIIACIGIWGSGEFSRDGVAAAFTPISVPVYLCLVLVLTGWGLELFWAMPERKLLQKHPLMALHRARARADLENCPPELAASIAAQQRISRRWYAISGAVAAVCAVAFLSYAVNPGHYSSGDVTGSVKQAVFVLLPCLAASFAVALASSRFVCLAAEKETVLLKSAPKKEAAALPCRKKCWLPAAQGAILAVAICMMVYGILSGGTTDVLAKAVNICTECVGLG